MYCLVQFFGGEWQCVVIVWVLINQLSLLFCDEFIGNFDFKMVEVVVDLFFDLQVWECCMMIVVMYSEEFVECFDNWF